ncbi:MAG: DNA repair ATPase [Bradymonadia bacterium]
MSTDTEVQSDVGEEGGAQLAGGNYDLIHRRLLNQAGELKALVAALDERRKATFGSTDLTVVGNERVRTEHNCVPRDIANVGGRLLFGYNVFMGLKQGTAVDDVLGLHQFSEADGGGFDFSALPGDDADRAYLQDPQFHKDFDDLYKYYRDTRLAALRVTESQLLAVFQVSERVDDLKVFRWRIESSGQLSYVDNRGDRDYTFPPSHDFEWKLTGREHHVYGDHPHVNIEDVVFVETVGGDLTIKIEDNTEDGEGIYSEPVDDGNQTLDDAEIHYARVGHLVLLKILPYRELAYRYLVFNTRTHDVQRIDGIGEACVQLPEDHGIMFPGGYYLNTGEHKVFEGETEGLEFKRIIKSPNGEDVMYVFFRRTDGHYQLLPYNLIDKAVQSPIECHGYSLFDDGRMVVFRALSDEPTRVHPMQVWQTPFMSLEFAASAPTDSRYPQLSKIGNADLVRGISELYSIERLAEHPQPNRAIFEDLIAAISRIGDAHFWLGSSSQKEGAQSEEIGAIPEALDQMRRTADLIVDEYEKVVLLKDRARAALAEAEQAHSDLVAGLRPEDFRRVDDFMQSLTDLRTRRGQLISVKEVRYIDLERIDALEQATIEAYDKVGRACVRFLLRDEALAPLTAEIDRLLASLEGVKKVKEVAPLVEKADSISEGLDVLTEVIGGLEVEDATERTGILESISEVFSHLNRARATLKNKRKSLLTAEGQAEFAAQFKLFGQSAQSALGLCDTPEKCDDQLGRLMVQLEELEARFSEFDEYLGDLASKREEVYEAFAAHKQTLLEERQRRAGNLVKAGERILSGVARRAATMKGDDELNAWFAADAMVMKLRTLVEQLRDLGDGVKADELESRLIAAKQEALRGLRDRQDLFEEGENVIKLGRHRFSVNTRPMELTLVPREDRMAFHLTGTDFYSIVDDEVFEATAPFWSQSLVSESKAVYRGEYLAASILFAAEAPGGTFSLADLHADLRGTDGGPDHGPVAQGAGHPDPGLLARVRSVAESRYDEGYERGLHDADATLILEKLLNLHEGAGLLRFGAHIRALGQLFWSHGVATASGDFEKLMQQWHRRAVSLGRLRAAFGRAPALGDLAADLTEALQVFVDEHGLGDHWSEADLLRGGRYLVEELAKPKLSFTVSQEARHVGDALWKALEDHRDPVRTGGALSGRAALEADLRAFDQLSDGQSLIHRFEVLVAWIEAFVGAKGDEGERHLITEVAALLTDERLPRKATAALTETTVEGLLGQHRRIEDGKMVLRIDEFLGRLTDFVEHQVPGYRGYRQARTTLLETTRSQLRLDEYTPKVMSAFVRNRLIDEVYLHMVGDNLAKQMGSVGEGKRTDQMGLLLLVSPPGYGKTTLMEYVANRLGLVFVKVNGPALGHGVISLDPSEAPNATARQEVDKINFALEMGNNVMLYLDDIQHTHPELLQKFISLCDAQRRIEGVWKGRTRTYDLRGKKFCVVMAGNPYTESGDRFQIPDMLANRADTYNLGDILEGRDEVFALSYVENSLTSNPTLAPLATRDREDIHRFIKKAQGAEIADTDFSHAYSAVEINEITEVLKRLFQVRDVLLAVNLMYIESAAQEDAYRTEPPFKLQGSYRNMNKVAEKVVAAMNAAELEALIDDHYAGESQTLTAGAEANLLKLAELRNRMSPEQSQRWATIKSDFSRNTRMGGDETDPATRIAGLLADVGQSLERIGHAVSTVGQPQSGVVAELQGMKALLLAAMEEAKSSPMPTSGPSPDQGALATALAGLQSAVEQATRPVVDLRIENAPPPGVEELLGQHVAIVERTLVPLVQTATQYMHDGGSLVEELRTLLDHLRAATSGGAS